MIISCPWSQDNMWFSNKILPWPGASKLINLIPNHHTGITRFHMHLIQSWQWQWVDPICKRSLYTIKGRWRDWGLCQATKAIRPTILLEWLKDSWQSSIRLPLLQSSGGSSNSVHAWHGPWIITICHRYAPKGCSGTNPNGWAPVGEYGIHIRTL